MAENTNKPRNPNQKDPQKPEMPRQPQSAPQQKQGDKDRDKMGEQPGVERQKQGDAGGGGGDIRKEDIKHGDLEDEDVEDEDRITQRNPAQGDIDQPMKK